MSGVNAVKRRIAVGGVSTAFAVAAVLGAGTIANAAEPMSAVPDNATEWNSAPADNAGIEPLATKYVGGGKWHYGTTGPKGGGVVYSDYYHRSKSHGSTVVNGNGYTVRSPTIAKGKWSHASASAVRNKVDRSYWWLA